MENQDETTKETPATEETKVEETTPETPTEEASGSGEAEQSV